MTNYQCVHPTYFLNTRQNVHHSSSKITILQESELQTLRYNFFKFHMSGIQIPTVFEPVLRSHEIQEYLS